LSKYPTYRKLFYSHNWTLLFSFDKYYVIHFLHLTIKHNKSRYCIHIIITFKSSYFILKFNDPYIWCQNAPRADPHRRHFDVIFHATGRTVRNKKVSISRPAADRPTKKRCQNNTESRYIERGSGETKTPFP
jgi:hypothetical protein